MSENICQAWPRMREVIRHLAHRNQQLRARLAAVDALVEALGYVEDYCHDAFVDRFNPSCGHWTEELPCLLCGAERGSPCDETCPREQAKQALTAYEATKEANDG